jgi:hypothetical protein
MVPGQGLSDTDIYIAVFGIGGQWVGRRLGFPSLLLLLPLGLLAGDAEADAGRCAASDLVQPSTETHMG